MAICTKCKKEISEEPYYSITNKKPYCSTECLSDNAFDQLYSSEYFDLVSSYRYFDRQYIETFEERINLESEMDLVIDEYATYYLGDSENSFYKSQIIILYEKLLKLYDEIHGILVNKESFVYFDVTIYWAELEPLIEKEILQKVINELIQGLEQSKIEFRNLSYDAFNEYELNLRNYKDVICVETEAEQKMIINILMDIFKKYNPSLIYDEESFIDHIHSGTVKQCPVCLHWEDESDFSFSEDLNVEICNQWEACRCYQKLNNWESS